jgi:DNA repair protein RecO (recombination protein O)
MPAYTTDALILRTYKLGESDRIVVFLTRDRGKKRGVARNARQSRRRFGAGLEPLTYGRVGYVERERRDLVHLQYVEPLRSPLAAADGDALGYVGYFAELIDEWAPEAHTDERLYRLGTSVLDALAAGVAVEPLARYFEFWLLRLQGVYPALSACPECGSLFDGGAVMPPREHQFLCRRCAPAAGGTSVSMNAMRFLKAASAAAPDALRTVPLDAMAARELETAHSRLINLHLEKELKSAKVLRAIGRGR